MQEPTVNLAEKEKKAVALSSVFASMLLTAGKLTVGLMTGSLGILSEAAHSALDLGAAAITYFAVSISDKPADGEHHYGHGKVENFSALIEAVLLLITCGWIIKEAVNRLMMKDFQLEITVWGFVIMVVSIIVDFSRSRALKKAAEKYNSQALEADALHFSSDILSSLVVIIGLIFAKFGFRMADPIAALVVAVLVIIASLRLAKETVDGLMDRAPEGLRQKIEADVASVPGVLGLHKIRVRQVGPKVFGDLHVLIDGDSTVREGHILANQVEIKLAAYASDVVVHVEPITDEMVENGSNRISKDDIQHIVEDCLNNFSDKFLGYHELQIFCDDSDTWQGKIHLVLPKGISLTEAHGIVEAIEVKVAENYPDLKMNICVEPCDGSCVSCEIEC